MGQFDNIVWNTSQGRLFMSTITEFCWASWLGRHFSPIFLFIAPFYYIWNSAKMLLVIKSFSIALAALPLYWLARDKLKSTFLALSFSAAFLMAPKLHNANIFDFNVEALETPLIIFAFYYLTKRKFAIYGVFLTLLLFCKEDAFLYSLIFGVYAFLFQKERKTGLLSIGAGLLWGFLTIKMFIPYFRGDIELSYRFLERYSWLGNSFAGIIKTLLFHPFYVVENLLDPLRIRSLGALLLPLAFLPLFSLGGFILIIPVTLEMLLSSFRPQFAIVAHYPQVVIPFYFIASVFGAYNLIYGKSRIWGKLRKVRISRKAISLSLVLLLAGYTNCYFFGYAPRAKGTPYSPLSRGFKLRRYRMTPHIKTGHKFLKLISPDALTSAQCCMVPHLTHRRHIYLYRGNRATPLETVEYIFLDIYNECRPFFCGSYEEDVLNLLQEKKYGVLAYEDGWLILKKGHSSELNEKVFSKIIDHFFGVLEGESLYRTVGTNMEDLEAFNKMARFADSSKHETGHLIFGPYRNYPQGEYRVDYRLKTNDNKTLEVVAHIDVCANRGETVFAERDIRGIDFLKKREYQIFSLNFYNTDSNNGLEFRAFFTGKAELWVDRIIVNAPWLTAEEKYSVFN